jgi:hypothetical protein
MTIPLRKENIPSKSFCKNTDLSSIVWLGVQGMSDTIAFIARHALVSGSSVITHHHAMKNIAFQYAHTLVRVRQSVDTFHPRYLFLPRDREHRASTWLLPDTLQHSILSLWLRAIQVGVAPTCFQTISSTHVLRLVLQCFLSKGATFTVGFEQRPLPTRTS